MSINYSLDDLHAFFEIARLGSFHTAAERLHLSPSAVSRRIKEMEDSLGVRLLDRTTRSVALTEAGRCLYESATPLISALDDAVFNSVRQGRGEHGAICISTLSSAAFSVVPQALEAFRMRFPNIRIQIIDDTGRRVTDNVLDRYCLFALTTLGFQHSDLHVEPIVMDPYVLVLPRGVLPQSKRGMNWVDLHQIGTHGITLTGLRKTSANRQQIDQALRAVGIEAPWFDEVENIPAMLGLLRQGKAAAVMPDLALGACRDWDLVSIALKAPVIAREIGLIRRKDTSLTEPALYLWKQLRQALQVHRTSSASRRLRTGRQPPSR
ncbi:LysR family transcriptional regulator [Bordetella sp. FB-8]|uniref:LysR family transcriptional regulator n=1 Tax=Bordetella sp. FB-8 TaxID=1159870 RepID=UPI000378524C|nr:LysR family transcriptional regulator [Bordetella sp. FB-8]